MKKLPLLLTFSTFCFALTGLAANWENGVSADWETDHWGMSGLYPGKLEDADSAVISGPDSKVELKSDIPHSVGELWVHNGGKLEIAADVKSGMAQLGCYGEPSAVSQTMGTLAITTNGFYLGYASEVREGCVATYNLSGGKLSVQNSEEWSHIGARTSDANALMVVSETGVLDLPVAFITNGTLEISGGSTTLGAVSMFDPEPVAAVDATIFMNGTAGSLRIGNLKAHGGEQGSATLKYKLSPDGVSPIEVTDLALNMGGSDARFVVDASAWNGTSGLVSSDLLVLIKYKKLWGAFNDSNVTLKGIKGTLLANYELGDGFKAIVLEVQRKP